MSDTAGVRVKDRADDRADDRAELRGSDHERTRARTRAGGWAGGRAAWIRAGAEAAMAYGLLGWVYVAGVAAFRPDSLTVRVSSLLPVRRDTFGTCCFALSALAAFALRSRTGTWWTRRPSRPGAADAALLTVAAYTLLTWAYLGVNSLTHPATIGRPLTHFARFPTEGATASWCFAVSAAALFAARLRSWNASPADRRPAGATRGGTR